MLEVNDLLRGSYEKDVSTHQSYWMYSTASWDNEIPVIRII